MAEGFTNFLIEDLGCSTIGLIDNFPAYSKNKIRIKSSRYRYRSFWASRDLQTNIYADCINFRQD